MAERAPYMAAASPRRVGRDRPLFGLRKDGSEVEIEVALRPQLREDGLLVVCFITDVSERRASEREIVEYQRKLQQMAFDAARTEECERRRIAADLHDRIGQSLALAQLKLKASLTTDPDGRPVQDAIDLLEHSIVDTRTLIFELSPPILYDLGLKEALSWLAEDLGRRWGMRIEISDDGTPKRLGDETAALVFRAVRELLTNVLKHAQVLSAKVTLERSGDQLEIAVVDEGVGFDVQAAAPASDQGGFGLFSACEQLSRLGGTLQIESGADRGTRVRLRLPLSTEPECAAPPSSKAAPW
jgi:signal transduction histidine kinase